MPNITAKIRSTFDSYTEVETEIGFSIRELAMDVAKSLTCDEFIIVSGTDSTLRLDLNKGPVISIDINAMLVENHRHIVKSNDRGGISVGSAFGYQWKCTIRAITMSGQVNDIQHFWVTQPMMSRQSPKLSKKKAIKEHKELVESHYLKASLKMASFLNHYIHRLTNT
jgi:hypothetical protein